MTRVKSHVYLTLRLPKYSIRTTWQMLLFYDICNYYPSFKQKQNITKFNENLTYLNWFFSLCPSLPPALLPVCHFSLCFCLCLSCLYVCELFLYNLWYLNVTILSLVTLHPNDRVSCALDLVVPISYSYL